MKQFSIKKIYSFCCVVVVSLLNIIYYHLQLQTVTTDYSKIWLTFYVWLACIFIGMLLSWYFLDNSFKKRVFSIILSDWKPILLILILASGTRFILLNKLDFVLMGDSLREIGYNALPILDNRAFNPFELGSYQGYGNFLPFIGSLFMRVFGTTALTPRLPAAIMSLFGIFLVYLFVRVWQDRKTAVLATSLLTFSLRYLYYSRSKIVITSPTFFLPLFFLLIYSIQNTKRGWFLLGIVTGLSFHFYVATRPIALIILGYLLITNLSSCRKQIVYLTISFFRFFLGLIVGVGPLIFSLSLQSTGGGSWILQQPAFLEYGVMGRLIALTRLYVGALANNFVLSTYPVQYPVTSPILEFPLNLLVIGFIILILAQQYKDKLSGLLLTLLLSLPFFLQVLSSDITQDQRNLSNVLIGSILGAISLRWLLKIKKLGKASAILVTGLLLLNLTHTLKAYFFDKVTYNYHANILSDYSLQAICEDINAHKHLYLENNVQVKVFYDQPQLLHVQEKIEYCAFPVPYKLLSPLDYLDAQSEDGVIYYYVDGYGLDLSDATEHKTTCVSGFLPQYQCPLVLENYSYFVRGRK